MRCVFLLLGLLVLAPSALAQDSTVTLRGLDGLPITADLYETGDRRDPAVLLFHQSASSRGEYRSLAPEWVALGFNVLAVDLRWGGTDRWHRVPNETALAFGTPSIMAEAEAGQRERVWPTIFAAYHDMLAASDWLSLQGFSGRRLALGSSFSAILVLRMPQDRPLDAVLAYSPGEYHDTDSTLVRRWAESLDTATYIAAAPDEEALSRPVYEAVRSARKTFFLAPAGRHGASILTEDPANWASLRAFLQPYRPPREVAMETTDGVTVHGDLYTASEDRAAPLVLLFHQGGGDARGEYGPLVPRLLERGYHALAIDQRRGGERLGGTNRTVAGLGAAAYTYCDAAPDLDAALAFVRAEGFTGPLVAWGSSYSGALALGLAERRPDEIRGVLAFSSASGAMDGCEPDPASLTVPALALRPAGEVQVESVARQLDRFEREGVQTYVAPNGVHGSSMLNPRRVLGSVEPTWNVVLAFLESALGH